MYNKTWFVLPLAIKLSGVILTEDAILDGDLQEEYSKLIKAHISLNRNKKLNARISKRYSTGTSLWELTCDILDRFHLIPVVNAEENGGFSLRLEKGSAWKKE